MNNFKTENEKLAKKVSTVAKSYSAITRELTKEEVIEIEGSNYWFDGWLNGPHGEQLVITTNSRGNPALKRI